MKIALYLLISTYYFPKLHVILLLNNTIDTKLQILQKSLLKNFPMIKRKFPWIEIDLFHLTAQLLFLSSQFPLY